MTLWRKFMAAENSIIQAVGEESFSWLAKSFNKETTLEDLPGKILDRVSSVDMTIRDYTKDRNAITAIALITFAYTMANKDQKAFFGTKDMLLLKILAKNEKLKREGKARLQNRLWNAPLFELITGKVGERIRAMRTMDSPSGA
jgi:hypothetical protein